MFELFVLFLLFFGTVNSLTPWFFTESRISRQRLAESFVGHEVVGENSDKEGDRKPHWRGVLLADKIPFFISF